MLPVNELLAPDWRQLTLFIENIFRSFSFKLMNEHGCHHLMMMIVSPGHMVLEAQISLVQHFQNKTGSHKTANQRDRWEKRHT